ncbi:hypothetical protein PR048_019032 [Dryococelus australis]|uniref:Uncharacterized protein n=1 Tax=Dryococelus australis TaxID=614101 RepID=A0ABQ9H2H0_9NEOP|nr:hypothetical protein PR048_019032 [Dryococelus australis]
MASKIVTACLPQDSAKNCMQRAALGKKAQTDPSQMKLFQATCWDLENIHKNFDDHFTILVVVREIVDLDSDVHRKCLDDFDNLYYNTITITESLSHLFIHWRLHRG